MADPNLDDDDDMPTAPFWMATFSDMATLLMTFFVLIVAMSEVEVKKFKEALSYFQGRPSFMTHDAVIPPPQRQEITSSRNVVEASEYEALLQYLEDKNLQDKVQVNLTEKGLHITITDSVMFRSGEAELIEPSRSILTAIAEALNQRSMFVSVSGHTDDRPIRTSQYPSNWELSAARAASVVRYFLGLPDAFPPSHYEVAGYGEFQPLESNRTPEGRARNRRVEILFSSEPWQTEINPYPTPTMTATP